MIYGNGIGNRKWLFVGGIAIGGYVQAIEDVFTAAAANGYTDILFSFYPEYMQRDWVEGEYDVMQTYIAYAHSLGMKVHLFLGTKGQIFRLDPEAPLCVEGIPVVAEYGIPSHWLMVEDEQRSFSVHNVYRQSVNEGSEETPDYHSYYTWTIDESEWIAIGSETVPALLTVDPDATYDGAGVTTDVGGGFTVEAWIKPNEAGTVLPVSLCSGTTTRILTVGSEHGVTTDDLVTVSWYVDTTMYVRRGMTVTATDATTISITAASGTGTAFPANNAGDLTAYKGALPWVYPKGIVRAIGTIACQWYNEDKQPGWHLMVNPYTGKLGVWTGDYKTGFFADLVYSTSSVCDGARHHIAVTFEPVSYYQGGSPGHWEVQGHTDYAPDGTVVHWQGAEPAGWYDESDNLIFPYVYFDNVDEPFFATLVMGTDPPYWSGTLKVYVDGVCEVTVENTQRWIEHRESTLGDLSIEWGSVRHDMTVGRDTSAQRADGARNPFCGGIEQISLYGGVREGDAIAADYAVPVAADTPPYTLVPTDFENARSGMGAVFTSPLQLTDFVQYISGGTVEVATDYCHGDAVESFKFTSTGVSMTLAQGPYNLAPSGLRYKSVATYAHLSFWVRMENVPANVKAVLVGGNWGYHVHDTRGYDGPNPSPNFAEDTGGTHWHGIRYPWLLTGPSRYAPTGKGGALVDWQQVHALLPTLDCNSLVTGIAVDVPAGAMVWISDFKVEHAGFCNLLGHDGTPFTVTKAGAEKTVTSITGTASRVLTVGEDHGITTGDTLSLFWQGDWGHQMNRCQIEVTDTDATTVTVTAASGLGDIFPANTAEEVICCVELVEGADYTLPVDPGLRDRVVAATEWEMPTYVSKSVTAIETEEISVSTSVGDEDPGKVLTVGSCHAITPQDAVNLYWGYTGTTPAYSRLLMTVTAVGAETITVDPTSGTGTAFPDDSTDDMVVTLPGGLDYYLRNIGWHAESPVNIEVPVAGSLQPDDKVQVRYYVAAGGDPGGGGAMGRAINQCFSSDAYRNRLRAFVEDKMDHLDLDGICVLVDEIKYGYWDAKCRSKGAGMGEMLADLVAYCRDFIKAKNPNCEVYAYNDALDPWHNDNPFDYGHTCGARGWDAPGKLAELLAVGGHVTDVIIINWNTMSVWLQADGGTTGYKPINGDNSYWAVASPNDDWAGYWNMPSAPTETYDRACFWAAARWAELGIPQLGSWDWTFCEPPYETALVPYLEQLASLGPGAVPGVEAVNWYLNYQSQSGTVSSATSTTLTCAGKSYPSSLQSWVLRCDGMTVTITSGKGAGQSRTVTGTASGHLVVSPAWDTIPDSSSAYTLAGAAHTVAGYGNFYQWQVVDQYAPLFNAWLQPYIAVRCPTIQFRRGEEAAISTVVLSEGEPAFTTNTLQLRVGDGVAAGGLPVRMVVDGAASYDITLTDGDGVPWDLTIVNGQIRVFETGSVSESES